MEEVRIKLGLRDLYCWVQGEKHTPQKWSSKIKGTEVGKLGVWIWHIWRM